jgi:hypothetical protein
MFYLKKFLGFEEEEEDDLKYKAISDKRDFIKSHDINAHTDYWYKEEEDPFINVGYLLTISDDAKSGSFVKLDVTGNTIIKHIKYCYIYQQVDINTNKNMIIDRT